VTNPTPRHAAAFIEGAGSPPAAGPSSMAWRLHGEMVLLAGWGRAILLQLAHPLVAEGVAAHSGFRAERRGRLRRLARTLEAMLALTFGTPDEAAGVARRINGIHDRVHGALPSPEAAFPAGHHYSAHDPALLAWVHATLVDSMLLTYELLVAPLTIEERDRYCEESCGIESLLGIPPGYLPRSAGELRVYMGRELSSGEVAVGDTARALAQDILYPPAFLVGRPLLALARLPTIGLLPPSIRAGYGLAWGSGRGRALQRLARVSRQLLPVLPSALRHWPAARRARARACRQSQH
jgi:uncharacterized protein (DUF2236 family)